MKSSLMLYLLIGVVVAVVVCGAQLSRKDKNCPENELYHACGPNCQSECSTLGQPCLINYIRCPDGCYCTRGRARDSTGKCIPIDRC